MGFGPLKIIEHEHEPPACCNPREKVRYRFEGEEPLCRVIRLSRRRSGRYSIDEPWAEPREFASASGHVLAQQFDVGMFDASAEDRPEGLEGHPRLVRSAIEDRDAHLLGGPSELAEQHGLSHARLTGDECASQARRGDQRQLGEQRLALGRSTYEAIDPSERSRKREKARAASLVGGRRRADPVPPGRNPSFDPHDLGGGLGAELVARGPSDSSGTPGGRLPAGRRVQARGSEGPVTGPGTGTG